MQNKPNFQKSQMNVSEYKKMAYDNKHNWTLGENKPNRTQNKPNLTQFKPISMPIKPNSNPNKPNFRQDILKILILQLEGCIIM